MIIWATMSTFDADTKGKIPKKSWGDASGRIREAAKTQQQPNTYITLTHTHTHNNSHLCEARGIRDDERHVNELGQRFGQQGLARARRANDHDVRLVENHWFYLDPTR